MIDGQHFRIKKNGKPNCNCYCRHPELIENYDKAVADTTQVYEVHHKLETHFSDGIERPRNAQLSKAELVALDMYFDRPPEEFIFLTKAGHRELHNTGKKRSDEIKRKISTAQKNREDLSKKVICVETCEVFESIHDAERKTGIYSGNISKACTGKYKTTGGYHWKFV